MPEKILFNYLKNFEQEFLEGFLILDSTIVEQNINEFKTAFHDTLESLFSKENLKIQKAAINLAQLYIKNEINYILLSSHIHELKNCTLEAFNNKKIDNTVLGVLNLFAQIETIISKEYLHNYIKKVNSSNNIRLASLNDMIQKDMIHYYEEHLIWLDELTRSINESNATQVPELNPKLCNFGKWLISKSAKNIIKNNSKYKNIIKTHQQLHTIGTLISKQIQKDQPNYHVLMNYLEKCELISLAIGTELALIDNTLIIKKASKDELTGALNRNSLDQMFNNQYELSLATDSNFLLAMCDLDHFKFINDNYGHVAGDKLLEAFVNITHQTLRKSDIVIRYGGEEFLIMLPNTNLEVGLEKLNEVREKFKAYSLKYENQSVSTSVSIGVVNIEPTVILSENKISMNDYIEKADTLLYKAKQDGRNRVLIK